MGVDVGIVTKPEFEGRQQIVDERFARGKERLDKIEEVQCDMVKLNVQFAEIIKMDRERSTQIQSDISDLKQVAVRLEEVVKTLTKNDENKDMRLSKLENEPKTKWDRLTGWIGGAGISAIIAYIVNIVLH